jgi:hypothetical protein
MGNATFYWYPDPAGSIEVLDLGEKISDLQVTPVRVARDAYSARGGQHRTTTFGALKVRIVLERFTGQDLAWKIESMQSHLERGGSVGFAADSTKAWCGMATTLPDRGDTRLVTNGNAFKAWATGALLAVGDIIAMTGGQPEGIVEYGKVGVSHLGGGFFDAKVVGLDSEVKHSFRMGPVAVRHRDFYPILRMPSAQIGRAIVTHDHRISYTLDMELQTDQATLADLLSTTTELVGDSPMIGTPMVEIDRSPPTIRAEADNADSIAYDGGYSEWSHSAWSGS